MLKKNAQEYVNEMGDEAPPAAAASQEAETKEEEVANAEVVKIKPKPRTKKLVTKLRITDAEEPAPVVAPLIDQASPPVLNNSTVGPPVVEIEATVVEEPVIKIKVRKPRAKKV